MSLDKPNWLLISKLSLKLYNETLETNFFKFTKGKLNVIKASQYNCDYIKDALEECMNGTEYKYLLVGGYKGMTVTKFNKLISGLVDEVNDKYIIIVTNKDQVVANSLKQGLMSNQYIGGLKNTWSKDNVSFEIYIKGNDFSMKCSFDGMRAYIRDAKLKEIGV